MSKKKKRSLKDDNRLLIALGVAGAAFLILILFMG
jgi:hypothetical protein